jgi:hypothetical protein
MARTRTFTPDQNATILRMRGEDATWTDIAKEISCSRTAVKAQYALLKGSLVSMERKKAA